MFTKARIYYIIIIEMISNLEFTIYYENSREDVSARRNARHTGARWGDMKLNN
jgi:hypothetical protein